MREARFACNAFHIPLSCSAPLIKGEAFIKFDDQMFDDTSVSDSSTTLNRWELTGGKNSLSVVQQGLGYFC